MRQRALKRATSWRQVYTVMVWYARFFVSSFPPSKTLPSSLPSAGAAGGGPSIEASFHSAFPSSSRKASPSEPLEVADREEPDDPPPLQRRWMKRPLPLPRPHPRPRRAQLRSPPSFASPVRRARRVRVSPRADLTAGSRSSLATRSREGKYLAARKRRAISSFMPGPRAATSGSY